MQKVKVKLELEGGTRISADITGAAGLEIPFIVRSVISGFEKEGIKVTELCVISEEDVTEKCFSVFKRDTGKGRLF